ncbi:hypothetical protein [Nostoc sp. UHCC 0251]|uniref:hypothetical protein n=1 Tax=Nostoc sp. UHCC 0251 TaxID=3110240 RepID=UPI002B2077FE|nr:hypothetical protein [Nostoc sp. UHCC 0251]MEA5623196.1 hypothetical protein [Nostoc sp. UHCC 0251]
MIRRIRREIETTSSEIRAILQECTLQLIQVVTIIDEFNPLFISQLRIISTLEMLFMLWEN